MKIPRYYSCLFVILLVAGCTAQEDKSEMMVSDGGVEMNLSESDEGGKAFDDDTYGSEAPDESGGATTEMAMPEPKSAAPSSAAPRNPGPSSAAPTTVKKEKYDVVRVFYGTNRDKTSSAKPNKFYGNQRGSLSIGHCDVSIPRNHVEGKIERPKIWKFEFRENPEKHIVLLNVQPTDTETFLGGIHQSLDRSNAREMFVFIHGYNVKFKDAALRTAQIAHDLEFDGVPMMFSWPTKGNLEDYAVDEVTSNWTKPDAYRFILAMAKFGKAEKIHVIAHSMGNRVLTGALDRLATQVSDGKLPKINQVILTAPDIDADTFRDDIAPRIVPCADRITIYASSNDRALKASKFIHGNSRLGLTGKHLSSISLNHGIDIVDASLVDTSLFGHSYYGDNVTVLDDIELVFSGSPVKSRGLVVKKEWNAWAIITKKNPFKALLQIKK